MMVVVDASVAAKWYLPEARSASARHLLSPAYECMAPDLIRLEIGSLLLRNVRRRQVTSEQCVIVLTRTLPAVVNVVPSIDYAQAAFEIAQIAGGSYYDAVYLAVARVTGVPVVTDDAAMVRTAAAANIKAYAIADGPPRIE